MSFKFTEHLRNLLLGERGAALVETAFGLPLFYLAVVFPVIDLFRLSFCIQSAEYALAQAIRQNVVWTVATDTQVDHADYFSSQLKEAVQSLSPNYTVTNVTVCPAQAASCPDGTRDMGDARDLLNVKMNYQFSPLFIPGMSFELSANLITRNEVTFQAPGTTGGVDLTSGYIPDWNLPPFVEPEI